MNEEVEGRERRKETEGENEAVRQGGEREGGREEEKVSSLDGAFCQP